MIDNSGAPKPRARLWFGVGALAFGSYLMGDVDHRWLAFWSFVVQWWPWALLALAVINLVRSLAWTDALLMPGLLAVVAVAALGLRSGARWGALIVNGLVPTLLLVGGTVMLFSLSAPNRYRWARFLWTSRVSAPEKIDRILRALIIIGELEIDFTEVDWDNLGSKDATLHVTIFFGVLGIRTPKNRAVQLHTSGSLLTRTKEPKETKETQSPSLHVHLLGLCPIVKLLH